jgi:hypothetical protein
MRACRSRTHRRKGFTSFTLAILCVLAASHGRLVNAQSGRVKKKITITSPKLGENKSIVATGNVIYLKFSVNDPEVTFVKVRVTTNTGDAGGFVIKLTAPQTEYDRYVPLFKGDNKIELFAVKGNVSDTAPSDSLPVECNDPSCYLALPATAPPTTPPTGETGTAAQPDASQQLIIIKRPTGDVSESTATAVVFVQKKSDIKSLSLAVYDSEENRVDYKPSVDVIDAVEMGVVTVPLKMAKGLNTIRVFDPAKKTESSRQAMAIVNCNAAACGTEAPTTAAVKTEAFAIELPVEVSNTSTISPVISIPKGNDIKKLRVEVTNGEYKWTLKETFVTYVEDKPGISIPRIKVLQGKNDIRVSDADNVGNSTTVQFVCNGARCANTFDNISFVQPPDQYKVENEPTISSRIRVQESSNIKRILVRVIDESGNTVEDDLNKEAIPLEFVNGATEFPRQIRVVEGDNRVTVFDAQDIGNPEKRATVMVRCTGSKCGYVDSGSSQTVRMSVGFEQAGASSATSETKPFLDFFFTTPLRFMGAEQIPRLSAWGLIRLSTTPEQTAAAGAFPSNLINQVSQTRETIGLVQSFDYLAGVEWRVFGTDGKYLGLGSNARKAHFYLVAGGGAINPLSSQKETVQIFRVPDAGSSQRELFVSRFGTEAAAKSFIGFVFPERDRFLRQFYGGLRLKTFDCEDAACTRYRNRFPATFDFMVGQNEAVTGGRLKNDITDDTGKIIGRKRSWVLRFDAFLPLSVRGAAFNLYGTALLKVGNGGVRITTPLFLDQAPGEILITNPNVFVAPNLQLDRDYYKIGVGFDLMRLILRQPQQ